MYMLLFCCLMSQLCYAQHVTKHSSQPKQTVPSLVDLIGHKLFDHHYKLTESGEKSDEAFECYRELCEQQLPHRLIVLLARCFFISEDNEQITLFIQKIPHASYPPILYDTFSNRKLNTSQHNKVLAHFKGSFTNFDHNKTKSEKKICAIIDFFDLYHKKIQHYNNRLVYACQNEFKPAIFKFLIDSGDQPLGLVIWDLIGDKQPSPKINRRMIRKLTHLTNCPITILPSPENRFDPAPKLKPLEYALAMRACWQDQKWTAGFYEKTFEKGFKPQLNYEASQATVEKYQDFYSTVVALLENSKNIMPPEQLQSS